MKKIIIKPVAWLILASLLLTGCQAGQSPSPSSAGLKVLAVESFLADIAQNVAGDRLQVDTLMPRDIDPHAFEPTPQDIARIAESQVLIANGAGLEAWLEKTLQNAGGQHTLIEAASGLTSRPGSEGDPHFWLNPQLGVKYVENIRDGLSAADPAGKEVYARNATAYIQRLQELDGWIQQQVAVLPPARRLIVTNHESFGYFADRYGFQIIGAILPSVSTSAEPSAQGMANLVNNIRQAGVSAIFLETGANPQLAAQIARETGAKVISDLYTHSTTEAGGKAPSYIDMMKYDVTTIVEALK